MPDVSDMIRQAAVAYGLDPETMVSIARRESGLNPNSANPKSSARGLFQFMTAPGGSWQEYGRGGNPLDPAANIDAGMRYTRDNISHLRSALGRDPTPGEIYLAHQQGRAGALALLQNPQMPAVQAISRFYKDPATAQNAIVLNGGRPDMTAGEFAAKWTAGIGGGSPMAPSPGAGPQIATQMAARPPSMASESPVSSMLATLAQQLTHPQQQKSGPRQLIYG